jgi:hypothetical protein
VRNNNVVGFITRITICLQNSAPRNIDKDVEQGYAIKKYQMEPFSRSAGSFLRPGQISSPKKPPPLMNSEFVAQIQRKAAMCSSSQQEWWNV